MAFYVNGSGLIVVTGSGLVSTSGAPLFAFDYYMSSTGDDNNAGTQLSPWSLTAFNSSTARAQYAGKKVGLLPGTYQYGQVGGVQTSLYTLYSSANTSGCILGVQGGSAGAPTLVGASDSSGLYSAPTLASGCAATLDSSQPGSGGSVVPVAGGISAPSIIGQSQYGTNAISTAGYFTLAGIGIKYFTYAGVGFILPSTPAINGLLIDSCEISFGANIASSNNPGAIFMYKFPQGMQVTNCKIHNYLTSSGTYQPNGMAGIMINQDTGTSEGCSGRVDHCTFYGGGQCLATKNNYSNVNFDHNYSELGALGIFSNNTVGGAIVGQTQAPGNTVYYQYNVIVGGITVHPEDGTTNQGLHVCTNNTFYCGPGGSSSTALQFAFSFNANGTTGSGQFNHNIVYLASGYNTSQDPFGTVGFNATGGGFTLDQNYYGTGCTFGSPGYSDVSLTTWQTLGFDANSSTISGSPFVTTPSSANLSSFVVTSGYLLAQDGTPCGALNSSGLCVDGTGIVGCNF